MTVKNGSVIDAETAELIKAEYLATKKSIRELAEKYEVPFLTLKQRAVYGKWSSERGQSNLSTQLLKPARKFVLARDSLKAKSERFLERMQQSCEDTLDILDTIQIPRQWDKLALREQVMSALLKRGFAAFGLNDGQSVNVTLQVQSELPAQRQLEDRNEVLDVETVPNLDTPKTPPEQ